jgi:hypothetical protein
VTAGRSSPPRACAPCSATRTSKRSAVSSASITGGDLASKLVSTNVSIPKGTFTIRFRHSNNAFDQGSYVAFDTLVLIGDLIY